MKTITKTITVNATNEGRALFITNVQLGRSDLTAGFRITGIRQAEVNAPDDMVMLAQVANGKSTFLVTVEKEV